MMTQPQMTRISFMAAITVLGIAIHYVNADFLASFEPSVGGNIGLQIGAPPKMPSSQSEVHLPPGMMYVPQAQMYPQMQQPQMYPQMQQPQMYSQMQGAQMYPQMPQLPQVSQMTQMPYGPPQMPYGPPQMPLKPGLPQYPKKKKGVRSALDDTRPPGAEDPRKTLRKLSKNTRRGRANFAKGTVPESSCPELFAYQYEPSQGGWYGYVVLPKVDGTEFIAEVNMTINKDVKRGEGIALKLLSSPIEVATGNFIKWAVSFPYQDVLPTLTRIKYNEQIVCAGDPEPIQENVVTSLMWAKSMIRISAGMNPSQGTYSAYPNNAPIIFHDSDEDYNYNYEE